MFFEPFPTSSNPDPILHIWSLQKLKEYEGILFENAVFNFFLI